MTKKEELEKMFTNKNLLTLALTHTSWINEHPGKNKSNERLEFLGDAILEFVVSKELYKKFPDKEEGYLTALRANLVNTVNLSKVAGKLSLGSLIHLSKGEEEGGGRKNPSLLANTVESVIGALYLDNGLEDAYKFINNYILSDLDLIVGLPLKDAKSRLQEFVQAKGFSAPKYKVIDEKGLDHEKKFTMDVLVDGKPWGKGTGKNKSEATRVAAKNALENLS